MVDRREPEWLGTGLIIAVHDRQIAEHGGASGIRDPGGLESAMTRPVNRWAYGEDDLHSLAAAYAFGLARNHPFADGNKRSAWIAARLFLRLNGGALRYETEEAIEIVLALAAGELAEDELADCFRRHVAPA